jgi:tetratricopeptide (TPR) repeat protein
MCNMPANSPAKPYVSAQARVQWATFAFIAGIAIDIALLACLYSQNNLIARAIGGQRITLAEALDNDNRLQTVAILQTLLMLVTALFFLAWLDRAWDNAAALGARDHKYRKAWGFFGFVVPIMNFFRPYQFVTEIWKASDPAVASSTRSIRDSASTAPVLVMWWGSWLLMNLVGRLATGSLPADPTLQQLQSQTYGMMLFVGCRIGAALCAILVIRAVNTRQAEKSRQPFASEQALSQPSTPLADAGLPVPDPADDYFQRGADAYDADNYDQAMADLDQAIGLNPAYVDAYLYRGLACYAQKRYSEAVADLETVVRLNPQNAEAYYWQGMVYSDMDEKAKAIEALENALRLDLEPELRPAADKLLAQIR